MADIKQLLRLVFTFYRQLRVCRECSFAPLLIAILYFFTSFSYAAPPIPFDGWSNSRGVISARCPTGYSCKVNVNEDGVLQRVLTDRGTGRKYMQLVIANGEVNGDGQTVIENFVDGNTENRSGIALKQVITQRGTQNLDYSVILNTGWADTPNNPTVEISQSITDTTPEGVGFDYSFDYRANIGPADAITGYYFGIRQDVTNSGNLNGSNGGGTDTHAFVLRRAAGDMNTSAGSATLAAPAGMGMGGGVVGGGGAAGGGGGGGMMMAASTGTLPRSSNIVAPRGSTSSNLVRIRGTSTGEGDAPCGADAPVNLTPGTPPPCNADPAPPNPGSQGVGAGAGAAAPAGTLTPQPGGGPTIPVPPQPPGAGGGIGMGMGQGGVPTGGTVTWAAGNEVQVIWIGQVCPGCVAAAMGGMGGASGSFSYQAYENLSTGAAAATRSIFGATPFNWSNPPFGPSP